MDPTVFVCNILVNQGPKSRSAAFLQHTLMTIGSARTWKTTQCFYFEGFGVYVYGVWLHCKVFWLQACRQGPGPRWIGVCLGWESLLCGSLLCSVLLFLCCRSPIQCTNTSRLYFTSFESHRFDLAVFCEDAASPLVKFLISRSLRLQILLLIFLLSDEE